MTTTKLLDIHDLAELSYAVGVRAELIEEYLTAPRQVDYYEVIRIAKRGRNRKGEYRQVYKAKSNWLSQLHRSISMIVTNSVEFGEHVQGFLNGRSAVSNAKLHMRKDIVVHADIKDFFNAITEAQVCQSIMSLGCAQFIASIIARACTIDGRLLQGTRCSPVISNVVCRNLDLDMLELARATKSTFSRYADNITFSGKAPPNKENIEAVVNARGFILQPKGCYVQYRGSRQFVTGLSVVDGVMPRLPKQVKKKLRLIAYYVKKYGDGHFEFSSGNHSIAPTRTQLEGFIAYAHSVEPEFAKKLWSMVS
ncbi:RNA-directed DNA polymerase [Pseudomonas sp. CK-NBRI-02]|uniref:reverse transcriptase family protein n=1 Tax=Pseudomonas sp. CK-NBRI-02 TaxID=2249759 RepID=UPI0011E81F04|nr:reverse transcriptase family protein [Pseudomonas sp. CK-NBRI-02]TYO74680.1 RNA-directed DNA polymerase [Pseudomonas sp. CK-NBRI-02]